MKRRNIIIGFLSVALLFGGCSSKVETPEKPETQKTIFTKAQEQLADVQTGNLEYRLMSAVISCTGEIEVPPEGMASVTAPLGAYIGKTEMVPGQYVKKGQQLATVTNPEYIVLQQSYLETSGELKFAEQDYLRQKMLQQQHATAEKKMQESESAFAVLKARQAGLRAQLKLVGVDLKKLEKGDIQDVVILRSPIAGYVTAVNHHPGEFVPPHEAIFEIVDMQDLHLHLNVFEQDIAKINRGQAIRFRPTSDDQTWYAGTVSLVSPKRSAEARSFDIHAHIETGADRLKPGMYVQADILTSADSVAAVPESALIRRGNEDFVLTEVAGKYTLQSVDTGIKMDGWVQILNYQTLEQKGIVIHGASRLAAAMSRQE